MILVHNQDEEALAYVLVVQLESAGQKSRWRSQGPMSHGVAHSATPGAGLEVGPFDSSYKFGTSQDIHLQIFSSWHACVLEYTEEAILISTLIWLYKLFIWLEISGITCHSANRVLKEALAETF